MAQEEDVAALRFLRLAYQSDVEHPGSDGLAIDGALKFMVARLIAKDAECEGLISSSHDTGRPIYKLREVEKKCSFDLVLFGSGLSAGRMRYS